MAWIAGLTEDGLPPVRGFKAPPPGVPWFLDPEGRGYTGYRARSPIVRRRLWNFEESDHMAAKYKWRMSTEAWGEDITLASSMILEYEVEEVSFIGVVKEVKGKLGLSGQTLDM